MMAGKAQHPENVFYWLMNTLDDVIERDPNVSSATRINLHDLLLSPGIGGGRGNASGGNELLPTSGGGHRSSGRVAALSVSYLAIFALSLVGNSVVCHVIRRYRRLHTVTNVFIANLAVSDIFVTVLNVPFHVMRHLSDDWPLGQFMCRLVSFAMTVFVYVSTFTMTVIAVDRYVVIVHPFRPRMSVKVGAVVVVVIWTLAGVMSSPYAIFAQVMTCLVQSSFV